MKNYLTLFRFLFKYTFKRSGEKSSRWLWVAYAIIGVAGAFLIYALCTMVAALSSSMQALGLLPEFLTLLLFIGCMAVAVFGLVPMLGYLYFSKDTVFLLALPVKPSAVFMAKLSVVYLTEIAASTVLLLPCMMTVGITLKLSALFYVVMLFAVVALPAIPLVLVAIIAIPLMYAVSFFKNKGSLTSVVMILLFGLVFGVYYLFISKLNFVGDVNDEQLESVINALVGSLNSFANVLFPLSALARLATLSQVTVFGSFSAPAAAAINLAVFCVSAVVLLSLAVSVSAAVYKRGARSMLESGDKKRSAKAAFVRSDGAFKALFKKEWRELFRTPAFAFQALSGVVLVPVLIFFMGSTFSAEVLEELGEGYVTAQVLSQIEKVTTFTLIGFTGMLGISINVGAATCITREGKCFYFMKSIPVPYRTQIRAKLVLYLLISSITLALGVGVSFTASSDVLDLMLGLGFLLVYNYGYNCICTFIDLSRPKLNWVTHNEAVKNNKNAAVPMIINMLLFVFMVAVPIVALLLVQRTWLVLLVSWLDLYAVAAIVAVVGHVLLFKNIDKLVERINV